MKDFFMVKNVGVRFRLTILIQVPNILILMKNIAFIPAVIITYFLTILHSYFGGMVADIFI